MEAMREPKANMKPMKSQTRAPANGDKGGWVSVCNVAWDFLFGLSYSEKLGNMKVISFGAFTDLNIFMHVLSPPSFPDRVI